MARILIAEPHDEIYELLELVVARLGHEPLHLSSGENGNIRDVDAVILEPAFADGFAVAKELRRRDPALPIVCVSIDYADARTKELTPAAHLLKPFHLSELERVITTALPASPPAP